MCVRRALTSYRRLDFSPFVKQMRFDRLLIDLPRAYFFGAGPAAHYFIGYMGFIKSEPTIETPDLQFIFSAGPPDAHPWFPGIRKPFANAFGCRAIVLHPKSTGSVELASRDPFELPLIIRWVRAVWARIATRLSILNCGFAAQKSYVLLMLL